MADEQPVHGTFCWNELVTRDTAKADKFYSELIGWKFEDASMTGMKYWMAKAGDKQACGMMKMPPDVPEQVPSHWMPYVTVDDVDSLVEKTKALGGETVHGPQDIPNVGRFLIVKDPTGAVVGFIQFPKQ